MPRLKSILLILLVGMSGPASVLSATAQSTPTASLESRRLKELEKLAQTDPTQALEQLRKLDADPATRNADRREIKVMLFEIFMRSDRREEAKAQIAALKALGERFHDQSATAQGEELEATVLKFEGDSVQAADLIEKSITLANATHDDELIFRTNETATEIYLDMGQFPTALTHALASLNALKGETPEVVRRRAVALDTISQIYAALRDGQKALDYNDQARATMRSLGDGAAETFDIDRGNAFSLLGDVKNAKKSFEDALTAARRRSSTKRELIALVNLANLLRDQKEYAQCVQYAQEGLRLAQKVQVSEYLYATYVSLGLCHIATGMSNVGQAEVDRGIEGLRKAGNLPDLDAAYDELATAYGNAGQYKAALGALREERKIAESLFQTDRSRSMAQMQAKFDTAERQRKIELLEEEKKSQAEELKNRGLQRSIAALSVALVALIAFVLIREKEKLKREAQKANLDKSKFLANAAHDLRQPMQAIGNLLEAARHAFARGDAAKGEELVVTAQRAAQTMRSSFNAVLELSRLDSGAMTVAYSVFDVVELVEEICRSMQPLAEQGGIRIRKVFSRKHCTTRSDRHLLSRVIVNLLSNAVKYSDPQKSEPAIVVGVTAIDSILRIEIVDNGIGIAESEHENVFKPFFQIDNPKHDREMGLGLGLSIVRSIVDLLDEHTLRMRSALGQGTRFQLDLPRILEQHGALHTALAESSGPDLTGTYILYVEDDYLVRNATEALLVEFGMLCDSSKSFEELAAKLSSLERMPDLILTDYRLSEKYTAIDVIEAVRTEFDAPIPVILLTGESEDFAPLQVLDGVVVLRKPISAADLLAQLRSALSAV